MTQLILTYPDAGTITEEMHARSAGPIWSVW